MNAATDAPVVVGVDDKPGSDLALRWAAVEAAGRHVPLRVVTAFHYVVQYRWYSVYDVRKPDWGTHRALYEAEWDRTQRMADDLVAAKVFEARQQDLDLTVGGEAIEGSPADVLLAESKQAAVLVVGSRQLKGFGSAILGSVGGAVAARAHCPAVVVRGRAGDPATGATVVVGVDGREPADAQLEFGLSHASRHGVPLRAVLCWRPDLLAAVQRRTEPPQPDEPPEQEQAERWLAEVVAGWQERYPDVPMHAEVVPEHPVAGLVGAAAGAHLLVVGTRGQHALAGTLLGSVSQGVLHHATCPVAVVAGHD